MKKTIVSLFCCALALIMIFSLIPLRTGAEGDTVYRVGEVHTVTDSELFGDGASSVTEWAIMDKFFYSGEELADMSDPYNWKMLSEGRVELILSVWYRDNSSKTHISSVRISFEIKGTVSRIASTVISGVPVPVEGELPLADVSQIKCTGGCSAVSITWTDESDGNDDLHSRFTAGTRYTANILLAPEKGGVFAETVTVKADGAFSSAAPSGDYAGYIVASCTFTAKAASLKPVIEDMSRDISAPAGTPAEICVKASAVAAGAALEYAWEIDEGAGFTELIGENKPYITVTAREDREQSFRCTVTAVKNGERVSAVSRAVKVVSLQPETPLNEITLENVTPPEFGSVCQRFVTFAQSGAAVESVRWYAAKTASGEPEKYLEYGEKFSGEEFYGVCVTIDGAFAEDVKATVNGSAARVISGENGVRVFYTFEQLKRVFIRQPADKTVEPGGRVYASWQTNFIPVKAEIIDVKTGETVHTGSRPAAEQAVPAVWYAESGAEYRLRARLFYGGGKDDYIESDEFVCRVAEPVGRDIDYVEITGVAAPERAGTPKNGKKTPSNAAYSVESMDWIAVVSGRGDPLEGTFRSDGIQYAVCFTVSAKTGHAFAKDCEASVNGYGAFTGFSGEKLVVIYNFGAVESAGIILTPSERYVTLTDPSQTALFTVTAENTDEKETSFVWYAAGEDGPDTSAELHRGASFAPPAIAETDSGREFTYYCVVVNETEGIEETFAFTCVLIAGEESSDEPASEPEESSEAQSEEISDETSSEPVSEEPSEPASEESSEEASEEISEEISEEDSAEISEEPSEESSEESAEESETPSEEESVPEESVPAQPSEESVPAVTPVTPSQPVEETEPYAWWMIPVTLAAIAAVVGGTLVYLKKRGKF